jgi:multidrug resistance protein MdtO
LADALALYAELPAAPAAAPAKQPTGFLLPDATTNPDHLRYAAKTTAAAMFCYLVYSQLDWPGIHTCMITCYIVSLTTLADSVEKLTLRIAGCLLGAALGEAAMVYAVPSFTTVGPLLCIVFVGAFVAAWIAAGRPRIAYAGFQIAFAFFLCVVQDSAPAFDLTVARDRVIGIILGNVVVYLVFTRCWPASVGARIESGIAAALRHLGLMVRATDAAARRHLAAQAQAALGAVEEDLELARYEPASVRPAREWLERRRAIAERAADLEPPLLLAAQTHDPSVAGVARRLDRLAGHVAAAADPVPKAAADRTALRPLLETRLRDLESAVAADAASHGASHAVA